MGRALIIGAGGVASVVVHKCCQNSEVFEEICIASRTKSKCDALKEKLQGGKTKIRAKTYDIYLNEDGKVFITILSIKIF